MNLRQKVKLAKCQLVELNRTRGGSSTWDIIQRYEKKFKLEKIIDYKRKPSRIYHWNEKYTIDLSNLTYISIHVDFLKIATLKSHNGKPLKLSEINNFLNKTFKTAVYEYATGVSKIKYDDTKKGNTLIIACSYRTAEPSPKRNILKKSITNLKAMTCYMLTKLIRPSSKSKLQDVLRGVFYYG